MKEGFREFWELTVDHAREEPFYFAFNALALLATLAIVGCSLYPLVSSFT